MIKLWEYSNKFDANPKMLKPPIFYLATFLNPTDVSASNSLTHLLCPCVCLSVCHYLNCSKSPKVAAITLKLLYSLNVLYKLSSLYYHKHGFYYSNWDSSKYQPSDIRPTTGGRPELKGEDMRTAWPEQKHRASDDEQWQGFQTEATAASAAQVKTEGCSSWLTLLH